MKIDSQGYCRIYKYLEEAKENKVEGDIIYSILLTPIK
jgi:hypothetical protein